MVLDLLLSTLIGNTAGRIFLKMTRFWINSAIKGIVSTTRIDWKRNPYVVTGLTYPNMHLPLQIISKTNIELTIEQIRAEVTFEGLSVGSISWFQGQGLTIKRKSDMDVTVQFVPPLQVFLLNLKNCFLDNGIADFNCSLGKVTVPFSVKSCRVDNFEQGIETIRKLLNLKQQDNINIL